MVFLTGFVHVLIRRGSVHSRGQRVFIVTGAMGISTTVLIPEKNEKFSIPNETGRTTGNSDGLIKKERE